MDSKTERKLLQSVVEKSDGYRVCSRVGLTGTSEEELSCCC